MTLFIYIHINYQLKTNNDLEIYEITENDSKEQMEEIMDIRIPVILSNIDGFRQFADQTKWDSLIETYPMFDIALRNPERNEAQPVMSLGVASKALLVDNSLYSENNTLFLSETGVGKLFAYHDAILRPHLVCDCRYDIVLGASETQTPFRYELNYRSFFTVTQGSIRVKLAPPKSSKYLHTIYDYQAFEFKSPINPWSPQSQYIIDFQKIKCMEIVLHPGQILFIPAYWWYSIKFNTKATSINTFKYKTYTNNLAILPQTLMYILQQQNVKRSLTQIYVPPNDETHVNDEKNISQTF
jgi:hypothetical protein